MRKTATKFGVSKSTVHKDLTERLPQIDHHLADEVRDILDINMGCPVNKIVKSDAGSALMKDPEHAAEIVREIEVFASSSGKLKKMACLNCYKISLK